MRDTKKGFSDFLQRCLESPFSRKLDLWSFLGADNRSLHQSLKLKFDLTLFPDVPRSRLVKYPLLVKQVLKFSEDATECSHLASAIESLEHILMVSA